VAARKVPIDGIINTLPVEDLLDPIPVSMRQPISGAMGRRAELAVTVRK
jgi:hypothetical protein